MSYQLLSGILSPFEVALRVIFVDENSRTSEEHFQLRQNNPCSTDTAVILVEKLLLGYLLQCSYIGLTSRLGNLTVIGIYRAEITAIASIKSFHLGNKYEIREGTMQPKVKTIDAIIAQCL